MSAADSRTLEEIIKELTSRPSAERLRLARMILETIETQPVTAPPGKGTLKDLLGLLKTDAAPPTDEECRAILEEELIEKHLK